MLQEKTERFVMLVRKRNFILITLIISFSQFSIAQDQTKKTWGISIIPGFSKTKNTVSLSYPPPPGIIDLKVSEPWQFVPHAEGYLVKKSGNYSLIKAVGISAYNYYDSWEYDPASTATNYVWGKRSFIFVYFAYKVGREFPLGTISLVPEAGLSFDYMVRAKYDSESKVGSIHQDLLSQLERINFGFSASVKVKVKLKDQINLQIGPYYKQLIKDYRIPTDKKLYFLGLSIDLIRHRGK